MGALIGHESIIGSSAFIAHGVVMSGCVTVGDGTFVGAGATILPRTSIGAWAVIGAGAVVTQDIPSGSVAVGNPAKVIKTRQIELNHGNPFK
jgi:acetyltransferase-like isoleucine patch superfamily enzyme